jgi:hypothetical protein
MPTSRTGQASQSGWRARCCSRRSGRCTPPTSGRAFFREITDPKPLESWKVAFSSELGIRRRHNVRAFLLSVYAEATSSDEQGIRQLAAAATAALKAVP